MLIGFGDALWRVIGLLTLGLVPWAAPVEVAPSPNATVAASRLAIALLVLVGVVAVVRPNARRDPVAALLAFVALLAAATAPALLVGERGPIARAVWVVSPLVWLTLAAFAAGPLARLVRPGPAGPSKRMRATLACVVVLLGGANLVAARPRLSPVERLWRAVLTANPGDEVAARRAASALVAQGRRAEATSVLRACVAARPTACPCVAGLVVRLLDDGLHAAALGEVDAAETSCKAGSRALGLRAEALAGNGRLDEASALADGVLAGDPADPHALYAKAAVAQARRDRAAAIALATRAAEAGRGAPAHLLAGFLLVQAGDLDRAAERFQALLALDPDNAAAVYDLALIAHHRNRYRDAREGYLRVLRLDPRNFDARYNLVVLTHDARADMEARHHLDKLEQIDPNDPRIGPLRRMLAEPTAAPAASP